ncbi:hypothetical protein QOT17_024051 [Balamuthia mandrillaris]
MLPSMLERMRHTNRTLLLSALLLHQLVLYGINANTSHSSTAPSVLGDIDSNGTDQFAVEAETSAAVVGEYSSDEDSTLRKPSDPEISYLLAICISVFSRESTAIKASQTRMDPVLLAALQRSLQTLALLPHLMDSLQRVRYTPALLAAVLDVCGSTTFADTEESSSTATAPSTSAITSLSDEGRATLIALLTIEHFPRDAVGLEEWQSLTSGAVCTILKRLQDLHTRHNTSSATSCHEASLLKCLESLLQLLSSQLPASLHRRIANTFQTILTRPLHPAKDKTALQVEPKLTVVRMLTGFLTTNEGEQKTIGGLAYVGELLPHLLEALYSTVSATGVDGATSAHVDAYSHLATEIVKLLALLQQVSFPLPEGEQVAVTANERGECLQAVLIVALVKVLASEEQDSENKPVARSSSSSWTAFRNLAVQLLVRLATSPSTAASFRTVVSCLPAAHKQRLESSLRNGPSSNGPTRSSRLEDTATAGKTPPRLDFSKYVSSSDSPSPPASPPRRSSSSSRFSASSFSSSSFSSFASSSFSDSDEDESSLP